MTRPIAFVSAVLFTLAGLVGIRTLGYWEPPPVTQIHGASIAPLQRISTTTTTTPTTTPVVIVAAAAVVSTPAVRVPAPENLVTFGDSSMMFQNAAIANAHPTSWTPVSQWLYPWTSGTGGYDRNGCGVTGDDYKISIAPGFDAWPKDLHDPVPEATCDWHRWYVEAIVESSATQAILSFGPTSMWGFHVDGELVQITDPIGYAMVLSYHQDIEDLLSAYGVATTWIAYPHMHNTNSNIAQYGHQYWDNPLVADAYYQLLTELNRPIVDLRDMYDPDNFLDGTHFTPEAAALAASRTP